MTTTPPANGDILPKHAAVLKALQPDLKNYAAAVLVREAKRRSAAGQLLAANRYGELHRWIDTDYLENGNFHIDHSTYRILEENMKIIMCDRDPIMIREASREIAKLPGIVPVVARAAGTPRMVVKASEDLNRELNFGQELRFMSESGVADLAKGVLSFFTGFERRILGAYHFIFNDDPYLTQVEGGVGYFEGVPALWGLDGIMKVDEPHSVFALAKLLNDYGDYGYLGWNIEGGEKDDKHLIIHDIDSSPVARPTTVAEILGISETDVYDFYRAIFVTSGEHAKKDDATFKEKVIPEIDAARPYVMDVNVEVGRRIIFPKGRVYGMPATQYALHLPGIPIWKRFAARKIANEAYGGSGESAVVGAMAVTRTLTEDVHDKRAEIDKGKEALDRVLMNVSHKLKGSGPGAMQDLKEAYGIAVELGNTEETSGQSGFLELLANQLREWATIEGLDEALAMDMQEIAGDIRDYIGDVQTAIEDVGAALDVVTDLVSNAGQAERAYSGGKLEYTPASISDLTRTTAERVVGAAARSARRYNQVQDDESRYMSEPSLTIKITDPDELGEDRREICVPYLVTDMVENIVRNSLEADASAMKIEVVYEEDVTTILYEDNGPGLTPDQIKDHYEGKLKSGDDNRIGLGQQSILDCVAQHNGELTIGRGEMNGIQYEISFPTTQQTSQDTSEGS